MVGGSSLDSQFERPGQQFAVGVGAGDFQHRDFRQFARLGQAALGFAGDGAFGFQFAQQALQNECGRSL